FLLRILAAMTLLFFFAALVVRGAGSCKDLEAQFRKIAEPVGGTVGVSVLHLESGRGASLHGHDRFPMASVFKLPVAIALLERVDRGALRLDQSVALGAAEI